MNAFLQAAILRRCGGSDGGRTWGHGAWTTMF